MARPYLLENLRLREERTMAKGNHGTDKRYVYKLMDSPIGRLTLVASDDGLAGILWAKD